MGNPVGRPRKFNNVEEIEKKVSDYKDYLMKYDKLPTIAGLAYYLGIDRQTLYNYSKKDDFFDTIKEYRDWVMFNIEQHALEKGNAGTIFVMKNYGYTDKQVIDNQHSFNSGMLEDIYNELKDED